jgi:hypothetical protein
LAKRLARRILKEIGHRSGCHEASLGRIGVLGGYLIMPWRRRFDSLFFAEIGEVARNASEQQARLIFRRWLLLLVFRRLPYLRTVEEPDAMFL